MSDPASSSTLPTDAAMPAPHSRVGVGGVLLRKDSVLVNRASYRSRFTIPSGFVEVGETLEKALVREFLEETGVQVRLGPLLLVRHEVATEAESGVYFAFSVDHVAGQPEARPPEIAESREVPIPEALDAEWISELSRLAIRLAGPASPTWPRDSLKVPTWAARAMEIYHAPTE